MSTFGAPVVTVLGTGVIGFPVARNLAVKGFTVRAWNRTRGKAEALAEHGVRVADTPADAVEGADVVVTLLRDGPVVSDIIKVAEPRMGDGVVWVQMSTVGEDVDSLAAFAAERGLVFVDAPVQGTRQPAENAELVVMAAGPEAVRPRVQPLFDAIGKRTLWVGDDGASGAASRLKLVLNTWVLALTHGVGEALALARALDVDPAHFVDVVTGGPMDNGYFQLKSKVILAGDFTPTFTVDNAEKDARLVLAAAERAGVRMDLVGAGRARFVRASAQGHGGKDMAAGYFASFID
ncbi:NAD(P)-dependent oxidoreductase [Micromonospora sp. WMMD1102]|uniref:NAD(P)-dependent oxidoreductase n=1 Tax=Micromonospora sp. WMMD1102 TaxID=3016105 RepID=UPI002414E531|nr:NAD(P)-dependent oxidoreductase [Micromonospora sp. WMMD1102]MDG4791767.1 NAD(P)-dependent oxidoreductase [Micromonospora sp. WMMD1102]